VSLQNANSTTCPAKTAPPTVREALAWARPLLVGTDSDGLDAQVLLAHVLTRDRAWILAHGEAPISPRHLDLYRQLVTRRAAGEPVAYLRGRAYWRDLELGVDPGVLIPRPETEHIVDAVLELPCRDPIRRIADIGTGSGAIAIALARALPAACVDAVDSSSEALRVAQGNVDRYRLSGQISLHHGHLLDPLEGEPDVLVANLPYLSSDQMESLPRDVRFEPRVALDGGETGLDLYRSLIESLHRRDWRPDLVFEMDPGQKLSMWRLLVGAWAGSEPIFLKDLTGRVRVAVCRPRDGSDVER